MKGLRAIKGSLSLALLFLFTFHPIIIASTAADTHDELGLTKLVTITSSTRTTVQLTSQAVNTKIGLVHELSVLEEPSVPTIPLSQSISRSSISSFQPNSSKTNVSPISTLADSFVPTPDISSNSFTTVDKESSTSNSQNLTKESALEKTGITSSGALDPQTTEEPAATKTTDTEPIPTAKFATNQDHNESVCQNCSQPNDTIEGLEDLEFTEEENAQFLSFEEWKKRKGVDPNAGQPKEPEVYMNRIPKNPNAKDSIGEEMEIDISNFFDTSTEPEGKIYKDKFNFASFDCAATIVKTNSEAKGATSILFENKDSYLLNPCSAPNKFVVIELCQDILVDSVVMGNFEFFSSTFKKIQISVSETFPVPQNGWKILGQFGAKDIRDFQTFKIDNPMIWAKYFRVEILEHYGNEFYCPLSVVRVHGKTMMQEYKQEEALQKSNTEKESASSITEQQEQESTGVQLSGSAAAASQSLASELVKSACPPTNDTSKVVDCILTNKTVNNSIRDLQRNLTNITDNEINDECLVSLPQLKFDELFNDFQDNKQSKCESIEYEKSPVVPPSTQSPVNTNTGTQESIYKNIMKRLSLLESNATLSVLYIEEQSKLLSTAFSNLEKKQSLKFDKLIDTFNTSIYNQLENLSTLYSLFQKQTDELLTNQRLKHEHLLGDANLKIDLLASDLKFQKILSFINGLVLTCVLVYVVITRETYIEEEYANDDKYWINVSKRRITSTGSRLRANIKRMYYNSDGGYDSQKSLGASDGEVDDGHMTPSSNEKQEFLNKDEDKPNGINTTSAVTGIDNSKKRPLTPENSDHE